MCFADGRSVSSESNHGPHYTRMCGSWIGSEACDWSLVRDWCVCRIVILGNQRYVWEVLVCVFLSSLILKFLPFFIIHASLNNEREISTEWTCARVHVCRIWMRCTQLIAGAINHHYVKNWKWTSSKRCSCIAQGSACELRTPSHSHCKSVRYPTHDCRPGFITSKSKFIIRLKMFRFDFRNPNRIV